jgi:alpha-tubulin suppressor-like RCC1 family protein
LRSNGTVVAWGDNVFGEVSVPLGLSGVTAVSAGYWDGLALKSNGTVVSWGRHGGGVPAGLSNVVAISASPERDYFHALALKSDGTVVGWGRNDYGESTPPPGLSNVIAVAAGGYHSLALKADGTVVAWGGRDVSVRTVPAGLTGVVAIAAGGYHNMALKSDRTVVAWQSPEFVFLASNEVPPGLTNVTGITAGLWSSVALVEPMLPVITQQPEGGNLIDGGGIGLQVLAYGTQPMRYQWRKDGVDIPGETSYYKNVFNVANIDAGDYTVVISNPLGSVESAAATITVGPWIRVHLQPLSQTVSAGTNVLLRVEVVGTWPFEYQWRKNGTDIPGATNDVLVINNAQPSDSGNYSVVAWNAAGPVTSAEATVLVRSVAGPEITAHPKRATVWVGAQARFSVTATGISPLTYQWLKDGDPLAGATEAILAIPNVAAGDADNYSVIVSNSAGSTLSSSAPLVIVTAPIRVSAPTGTVVSISGPMVPPGIDDAVAIAAGTDHGLALRSDGTVTAWGGTSLFLPPPVNGSQINPPPGLSNVVAIAAGERTSIALKNDGTVVTWGVGSTAVPPDLSGVVAIDTWSKFAAVKADGTVVTWPPESKLGFENVVAVSGARDALFVLQSDGTLRGSGLLVPSALNNRSDVAAVAVGGTGRASHTMALLNDARVLDYSYGNPSNTAPADLTGVVAIAAGDGHSLALKADGTVVGWNGANMPTGLASVSAISAGRGFSLLITTNPPIPMLAARRMGEQVLLAAPVSVSGFVLEQADGLQGIFTPLDLATNASTEDAVILQPTSAAKFFRLRKLP